MTPISFIGLPFSRVLTSIILIFQFLSYQGRHSESESEGEGDGGASGNIPVLSSLVQFGSNLFRPDLKRPAVRGAKSARGGAGTAAVAAVELDPAHLAALEAAAESEFDSACFVLIQCINGIESQEDGLQTHVSFIRSDINSDLQIQLWGLNQFLL